MISNKHITKIAIALVLLTVILCFSAMIFSEQIKDLFGASGYKMEYETELFDTSKIISLDIQMSDDEWNEMLENAASEEYYKCNVVIGDKTFYEVGIRPKGNTSLSSIANDPDNNRYSFKLEFDQYADGQTCFGLDKLVLNNSYADTTNMKEAVIYDMYAYLDADAPLYNYAEIYVNGEYWGVYLALEAVEDSFMLRNFGTEQGYLYKPDSMNMGKRNDDETENRNNFPGGRGGGANLNYSDDNLDSYSAIWDGEVNDSSKEDHTRVVEALKYIHKGENLERYLDVDNVLKYMAVHSFAVNDDSLSGNMAHNYYLYESSGRLNILPWDYNLAFGGMNGNNASNVINDPIDSPFSATQFFDSLLNDEEYKTGYHEYYRILVEEYVSGGVFDETYNRIRNQIDGLVKDDPTVMYTIDEYNSGTKMLYDVVKLRAESVKGQLNGTIPSTTEGQRTDSSALIDASAIDISALGSMHNVGGGGGRGGFGGKPGGKSRPFEGQQINKGGVQQ